MAQTPGFYPTPQVKTCFDCKMFDVSNWVASLNGENGPRGTTSHQGALEISSTTGQPPSLDRSHLCTPGWWQNPANVMKGSHLHPKDHSIQLFTDASNEGWGTHLEPSSTHSLWSPQVKGLHINVLSGPETLQRPVSGPNRASCDGQLNCGGLHKQTRGNTLNGDVCTHVENHDMVPSFSHHIESQAHSRVSECDGRPTFQVESGTVNRMVGVSRLTD